MHSKIFLPSLAVLILFLVLVGCNGDNLCILSDIEVTTGECNCADNYSLVVDFEIENPSSEFVELFIRNNISLGFFKISDRPFSIDKFEISPNTYDYLKICMDDNPNCCAEIEFIAPDCSTECGVSDLEISSMECNEDGLYPIELDFTFQNSDSTLFDLFIRDNELVGTYALADLPLTIENFSPSGNVYDFVKICINDNEDCCAEIEFISPDCIDQVCSIFDLIAQPGACNNDGSYVLQIDFEYLNPENEFFDLFIRNDEFIGFYSLDDLPLTIDNFIPSGNEEDFIRVCINDNPNCCQQIEFVPPECSIEECDISTVEVTVGECTSQDTYTLVLDFEVVNANNDFFEIFLRNKELLGFYEIGTDLPLEIKDFRMSGEDYDYIEICINDNADCCYEVEFMPPEC